MFKTFAFALASMVMVAGAVQADDLMNELQTADVSSISDASAEIDEAGLDGLDVDQLAADAGTKADDTDAIEACFRRFGGWGGGYGHGGYGGYGCGYRSFGWGCYSNYSYCYSPCYSYNVYRPYVCQPSYSYSYCSPVCTTSYWGCY
jgi:hypothetical protein